jgi:glycerate kinase
VAGRITASTAGFASAVSLTDLAGSPAAAMSDALGWLERAGAALAAAS